VVHVGAGVCYLTMTEELCGYSAQRGFAEDCFKDNTCFFGFLTIKISPGAHCSNGVGRTKKRGKDVVMCWKECGRSSLSPSSPTFRLS
jgi:hypothetical protein